MTILGKKQMSEEDIKLNFITPAIQRGWKGHITMETRITDGRINIRGNIVVRSKPKFADYLLYLNDGKPIAVVEAKDNNHSVSHGLQQAMTYGKKPLTRKERASKVKKKDFFSKYSAEAQAVLGILLDKYMNQGITEVEDIKVLSLADFANFGKPAKIVKLFGGKAQYEAAIRELEESIYEFEVV